MEVQQVGFTGPTGSISNLHSVVFNGDTSSISGLQSLEVQQVGFTGSTGSISNLHSLQMNGTGSDISSLGTLAFVSPTGGYTGGIIQDVNRIVFTNGVTGTFITVEEDGDLNIGGNTNDSQWSRYPALQTVDMNTRTTQYQKGSIQPTVGGLTINVDSGDEFTDSTLQLTASEGSRGVINLTAQPGSALVGGGKVSITANGTTSGLIAYGGEVTIDANTSGFGDYGSATSAIKLSAAGINNYAGAIPSFGSLAGYLFNYGTLGINNCVTLPSVIPNAPLTHYTYAPGTPAYGGIRMESPFGVECINDTDFYAFRMFPYLNPFLPSDDRKDLLVSGRINFVGKNQYLKLEKARGLDFYEDTESSITGCKVLGMTGGQINNTGTLTISSDTLNINNLTATSDKQYLSYDPVTKTVNYQKGLVSTDGTAYGQYYRWDGADWNINGSSIALGTNAGLTGAGNNAIAIGNNAGLNQNTGSISIGVNAGATGPQGSNAVAIGSSAGNTGQKANAVAVGISAGQTQQAISSVAVGAGAGQTNQGANSVAVGVSAGNNTQANGCVAIGNSAGATGQKVTSIAIGFQAGQTQQNATSVAIGRQAGQTNQSFNALALGAFAGQFNQGDSATSLGFSCGQTGQGFNSTAIGIFAGQLNQGNSSTAIGFQAGNQNQGFQAVSIGDFSGGVAQGQQAIAMGVSAGATNQGNRAVSIGYQAGFNNQKASAIAIGENAGQITQGTGGIAIGQLAGQSNQAIDNIAIGVESGGFGSSSIAIGKRAGFISQADNSIILNASGSTLNGPTGGFYVNPVRAETGTTGGMVFYDGANSEVCRSADIVVGPTGTVSFSSGGVLNMPYGGITGVSYIGMTANTGGTGGIIANVEKVKFNNTVDIVDTQLARTVDVISGTTYGATRQDALYWRSNTADVDTIFFKQTNQRIGVSSTSPTINSSLAYFFDLPQFAHSNSAVITPLPASPATALLLSFVFNVNNDNTYALIQLNGIYRNPDPADTITTTYIEIDGVKVGADYVLPIRRASLPSPNILNPTFSRVSGLLSAGNHTLQVFAYSDNGNPFEDYIDVTFQYNLRA